MSNRFWWRASCSLACISFTLAAANAAQAQDKPEPAKTADPSGQGDIVVTAQKREQSLQKVPLSVNVTTGDQISRRNLTDMMQITELAPSLQQQTQNHAPTGVSWSIRGVGTAVFQESVEASVSTVIDGVSLGQPRMAAFQLFDIDRVEVLSGPQGTLFGKNASAGLINIVTKKPVLNETSGSALFSYGSQNTGAGGAEAFGQATINLPLSETLATRISIFGMHRDPLVKNVYSSSGDYGQTQFGMRVKLLWKPSEDFDLYAIGDLTHSDGAGLTVYTNSLAAPGGFIATKSAALTPEIDVFSPVNNKTADNEGYWGHFSAGGLQSEASFHLTNGMTISNLAAYRFYKDASGGDVDHLPISTWDTNVARKDYWQFSNELRFLSPTGGRLEYVAGIYYFHGSYGALLQQGSNGEGVYTGTLPPLTGFIGVTGQWRTKSDTIAGYAQTTLTLFDGLKAIGGLRLTHDNISNAGSWDQGANLVALQKTGTFDYSAKETNLSYKLGLQYEIERGVMVYGSYTRGYKGPGLSRNVADPSPVVGKEIPLAWELGLKSRFFDRKLTLNASVWDETFKGFQAQAFSSFSAATLLLNAGSLKSRGAEVQAQVQAFTGLSFSGSLSYVDAFYKSFEGNPCYPLQPKGSSGTGVCLPNYTTDASGNRLQGSSKWTYTLSASYEKPVSGGLVGVADVTWYHRSSYYDSATEDPKTHVGGYGLLGGSIGVRAENGRWKLSLYARNILDKRFPGLIIRNPIDGFLGDASRGGDYLTFWTPDSFRSIGAALNINF